MKAPLSQWLWTIARLAILGMIMLGVFLLLVSPHPPAGADGLVVSPPVFSQRTFGTGTVATVTLQVKNTSPQGVGGAVNWFEWRSGADHALLGNSLDNTTETFELPAGGTATLVWDCEPPRLDDPDPLFCGRIHWWDLAPLSTRLFHNVTMSRLASFIDSIHFFPSAPWRWQSTEQRLFVSNVEIEDYFREVYDLTCDKWREKSAREAKEWQALLAEKQLTGDTTPLAVARFANTNGAAIVSPERIQRHAEGAFGFYCQSRIPAPAQTQGTNVPFVPPDAVLGEAIVTNRNATDPARRDYP